MQHATAPNVAEADEKASMSVDSTARSQAKYWYFGPNGKGLGTWRSRLVMRAPAERRAVTVDWGSQSVPAPLKSGFWLLGRLVSGSRNRLRDEVRSESLIRVKSRVRRLPFATCIFYVGCWFWLG